MLELVEIVLVQNSFRYCLQELSSNGRRENAFLLWADSHKVSFALWPGLITQVMVEHKF